MIFYLVHELMQNYVYPTSWKESKKNCLTFLLGANLHVVLFVVIQYFAKTSQNMLVELFFRFYFLFFIIDAIAMAIIYKSYWGRSIVNEFVGRKGWLFDSKTHTYTKREKKNVKDWNDFMEEDKETLYADLSGNVHKNLDNVEKREEKENAKDWNDFMEKDKEILYTDLSGNVHKNLDNIGSGDKENEENLENKKL